MTLSLADDLGLEGSAWTAFDVPPPLKKPLLSHHSSDSHLVQRLSTPLNSLFSHQSSHRRCNGQVWSQREMRPTAEASALDYRNVTSIARSVAAHGVEIMVLQPSSRVQPAAGL